MRLDQVVAYCSDDLVTAAQHVPGRHDRLEPERLHPRAVHPLRAALRRLPLGPVPGHLLLLVQRHAGAVRRRAGAPGAGLGGGPRAITRDLLHGSKAAWGNVVAAGYPGYPLSRRRRLRSGAARRLLAAAGYPGGRGFPPAEILFNTSQDQRKIAEAIQAMWKRELGIEVRLAEPGVRQLHAGDDLAAVPVARRSWIADYNDPSTFLVHAPARRRQQPHRLGQRALRLAAGRGRGARGPGRRGWNAGRSRGDRPGRDAVHAHLRLRDGGAGGPLRARLVSDRPRRAPAEGHLARSWSSAARAGQTEGATR